MQKMTVLEATEGRAPKIAQAATSPFVGKVFSKDGTAIAFDRIGNGPPVILIVRRALLPRYGSEWPTV
jgi:hypothetical protein